MTGRGGDAGRSAGGGLREETSDRSGPWCEAEEREGVGEWQADMIEAAKAGSQRRTGSRRPI